MSGMSTVRSRQQANNIVDTILILFYVDGLIITAFDARARAAWRRYWLRERPAVVRRHDEHEVALARARATRRAHRLSRKAARQ